VYLTDLLEGKSAALFVVLAGMGISLMGKSGELSEKRLILLKRGLFLFCFGFVDCFIYNGDILHVYGVFLAVAALLLRKDGYFYIFGAVVLAISYVPLFAAFDYDTAWNWQNFEYADFFTIKGFLRNLFFNGFFPVGPWLSFLFVGMWLGNQDLSKKRLHNFLIFGGIILMALAAVTSHYATEYMSDIIPEKANLMRDLFGTDPIPPLPLYIIMGVGFAFLSIGVSFKLEANLTLQKILHPLVLTGRQTLSLYVAHILFFIVPMDSFSWLDHDRIEISLLVSLSFIILAVIFSSFWFKRFKQGPVEMFMRKITG
jgi:uncharacterized membrane protein YeiB